MRSPILPSARLRIFFSLFFLFLLLGLPFLKGQGPRNTKADGYRGIWFELDQKYAYGDKYAGGLGTYTAKHRPMAVSSPEADKTFFVYGGTTAPDQRHLLCMAGCFDHRTGMVPEPTVVRDKPGVNDPYDNPSIALDKAGYVWVMVSAYPRIWHTDSGFFHFFTKYTGIRELY